MVKSGQILSNLKSLLNRYQIVTKIMCKIETWRWADLRDDFGVMSQILT
ncbi:hypothetical protein SEA_HYDRUS_86 [Gordonia phage Hydrus]|nr:hypothetical protein SEA_HYDRUS_86 [Gordonia phage Hydrus]